MKEKQFIVFNAETFAADFTPTGKPIITFSKQGFFSLNKVAATLLNLKKDDKVSLSQDEEFVWYVSKDPKGFPGRNHTFKRGIFEVGHRTLVKQILDSFTLSAEETHCMELKEKPVKYNNTLYFPFHPKD